MKAAMRATEVVRNDLKATMITEWEKKGVKKKKKDSKEEREREKGWIELNSFFFARKKKAVPY